MHLRMTGNLLLRTAGDDEDVTLDLMDARLGAPRLYEASTEARHLRAAFELDDGSELWFTDARRFGHGVVLDGERARRLSLGAAWHRAAHRRAHGREPRGDGCGADGAAQVASYSTKRGWRGSGTSMRTRRFIARRFIRSRPQARCGRSITRRWSRGSSRRWRQGLRMAAPRLTTTATRVARRGRCRTSSSCIRVKARSVRAAAARSSASWLGGARRTSARIARRAFGGGARRRRGDDERADGAARGIQDRPLDGRGGEDGLHGRDRAGGDARWGRRAWRRAGNARDGRGEPARGYGPGERRDVRGW